MNHTIIIIIGVTGDLSRRHLLPALYHLITDRKLISFSVIGIAQEQTSMDIVWNATLPFIGSYQETVLDNLVASSLYIPIDLHNDQITSVLYEAIIEQEKKYGPSNRLVYCATAASFFEKITLL